MSTKIYDAFLLLNIDNSLDWLKNLESDILKMQLECRSKLIGSYCTRIIDENKVEISGICRDNKKTVFDFMIEYFDQQVNIIEQNQRIIPEFDFNLSVIIFDSPKISGKLYTECQELRDYWYSLPQVKDYSYWNNTDHPDDVTIEEWEERYNFWKTTIPTSIPSNHGKIFDFKYNHIPQSLDSLVIPSYESRLQYIAYEIFFNEIITTQTKVNPNEDDYVQKMIRNVINSGKYLQSNEGKQLIESVKNRIKHKINPHLSVNDFLKPLEKIYVT